MAVVMDDPRELLKAAGVECAEVEEYAAHPRWVRTPHGELTIDKDQADAAILALARLVVPLARFLNAERALNDPETMEGTTHCQTDAHVEADQAYREACAALGLDSFLEHHG